MTHLTDSNLLWQQSDYARQLFAQERGVLSGAMRQAVGPSTLQVGALLDEEVVVDCDLPYLVKLEPTVSVSGNDVELHADPAFLPFAPDSFSTVILPHVLEWHELPHQVLREAHRVLMPEGHLVLTGFNPISLLGMQRWVYPRAAFQGRYYTSRRVIDWLQLLGFEVVASAMYQYAPVSKSERMVKACRFLESIGDRWLPMMGGGYMITAKKREANMRLIGRVQFSKPKRAKLAAASVKTALKKADK